ncbi:MAG: glycosyl hydrolase, partial [Bacteroidota bacterium]
MKKYYYLLTFGLLLGFLSFPLQAQRKNKNATPAPDKGTMQAGTFAGMKFRSIGPAFMSGRISDLAIHPDDDNVWYVTMGSGGIWKTKNAGITWKPIFDNQPSYSIGCITIDPSNPHTLWVGSGENVGGRHVGYGDGVYRSQDDG